MLDSGFYNISNYRNVMPVSRRASYEVSVAMKASFQVAYHDRDLRRTRQLNTIVCYRYHSRYCRYQAHM